MKTPQILLSMLILLSASCTSSEEVKSAARDAATRALFTQIITSIEYYEVEYDTPILASDSIELADVLEGKNKRKIFFYSFDDGKRNQAGEIIDAHGNPIKVRNQDGQITLYSNGKNGIMDSAPSTDDIVMHYKTTKHNQSE
jgi:hypothetical protein